MTKNLLDTLNDISSSLTTLALQVRSESLAGLGSRNKVAEQILLPVLRRLYNAPNLSNTNAVSANFPGIDLFDPASGLGVQVTSETTASKIAGTIETTVGEALPLTRLVVALIADKTPSYQKKTKDEWEAAAHGRFAFAADTDVFGFDRLLSRIQLLPKLDIDAIAVELGKLVRGAHHIQLLPHLQRQAEAQIAEEIRIARYIPDVFVETHDTKYQARCFANPTLFTPHIAGWFGREPFSGLNRLATMSGLPPVPTPATDVLVNADTLDGVVAAARTFREGLKPFMDTLEEYRVLNKRGNESVPRDPKRGYVFEETRYYIDMGAAGMVYRLKDRATELGCVTSRFFLLTGPAGQGKTNFICDFTERFLLRHGIPCAYITARHLSRIPDPDLCEVLRRLIFPPAVDTFEEGLASLFNACAERRQPFVIVIDGLNEHPHVRSFAGQLEHLLETLVPHAHVRVLMTCRSEFLEQRFGSLLSGRLSPHLHVSTAHGHRFEDDQYRELVARYFRFFKVRPSLVSERVIEFLQRDILLLRFFCEAYGARGRNESYQQPFVEGIYRDEIFRRYVEDKLGRAQRAVADNQPQVHAFVRPAGLRRVLSLVAAHMLETGQYTDVPRNVVPPDLDAELAAVLDEELVLRHDLGSMSSLLAEPEEVLNFTFDEMRDFLLAQQFLAVHAKDPGDFNRLAAAQQPTTSQSIEGVQRFLFYASRVPANQGFLHDFRAHPWYMEVYDSEVFAVPPEYHTAEDVQIVESALAEGGARAQHFARRLALNWETSVYPVLNLELLLAFTRRAGATFFDDVIVSTFGLDAYGRDSLGEAFCRFVEDRIIPEFNPNEAHPYGPVFRLLLLLLPVSASRTLDSPAVTAVGQLIAAHPGYAVGLVRDAMVDAGRIHRALAWRLLSMATSSITNPATLIKEAEADAADDSCDPVIRQEAGWFLTRTFEVHSSDDHPSPNQKQP